MKTLARESEREMNEFCSFLSTNKESNFLCKESCPNRVLDSIVHLFISKSFNIPLHRNIYFNFFFLEKFSITSLSVK